MIEKHWYSRKKTFLSLALEPISYIFSAIATSRKNKYQNNAFVADKPIIVVGNISVGGTGKTPVVRAICEYFLAKGKAPAIVSRGYGAKAESYPFLVATDTKPSECGDEPFMMFDALSGKVPIAIDSDRSSAIRYIQQSYPDVDIIISDDGLQHYKMARDFEIAVVDAGRMFGNGLCLPAGPLREPISRVKDVDMVIAIGNIANDDERCLKLLNTNTQVSNILPKFFVNVKTAEKVNLNDFVGGDVIALAGIGNPTKFFDTLAELGCDVSEKKSFKDHHKFIESDFDDINDTKPIIMTYKDAVKCKDFAKDNWWYLDIGLDFDLSILDRF